MDMDHIKANATVSGTARENFRWYFLDGVLYIEGTGELDYVEDWTYFFDPPADNYYKRNKPVIHPWKDLIPRIRHMILAPGCTALGLGAFEEHGALESVVLPHTLRRIGAFAFHGCIHLKDVTWPEALEEIDDFAFLGCVRMEQPRLPADVRTGIGAFRHAGRPAETSDRSGHASALQGPPSHQSRN